MSQPTPTHLTGTTVTTELESQIQSLVALEVRGGFGDRDEIIERVLGSLEMEMDGSDTDLLEPLVAQSTDEHLQAHQLEQTSWAEPTDCDRLDAVFAELEGAGILVGQNYGDTQDDALADLSEVFDEHHDTESLRGYVFYTHQDLERAVESGTLALGFGMANDDGPKAVEVGKILADAFKQAGFQVKWNGKTSARIEVGKIDWKRRRSFE
jgi:hypothetical protein